VKPKLFICISRLTFRSSTAPVVTVPARKCKLVSSRARSADGLLSGIQVDREIVPGTF
jgi:hypothetical protein